MPIGLEAKQTGRHPLGSFPFVGADALCYTISVELNAE